MIIRISYFN